MQQFDWDMSDGKSLEICRSWFRDGDEKHNTSVVGDSSYLWGLLRAERCHRACSLISENEVTLIYWPSTLSSRERHLRL